MIKAVIFDYGNVISSVDNNKFFKEISRTTGRPRARLEELIRTNADALAEFEIGRITFDEFFLRVVKSNGLNLDKDAFLELFSGRFKPIKETHDLIRRLKPHYKLGLLSNTNELDFKHEIEQCGVFHLFDAVAVSFRVAALKPDNKIYLYALSSLGAAPAECIYIDDIPEYVDAARALGITGIHYTSHKDLVRSLRELDCLPE